MNYNLAEYLASYGTAEQLPAPEYPELVFSGRSNVGKSSAINRVFGRKALAFTSATPGKTTTINCYGIGDIRFVDLPGYGYARRSASERERWAKMIEGYFDGGHDIRLVVQLIDARHSATADDRQMLDFLIDRELPFLVLLTKCDKLNKTERAARMASFAAELPEWEAMTVLEFSAVTGEGVEALRAAIEDVVSEE